MKWFDYLLSTRAMALLLLLMASAVGVATFIENSYDTITAKVLIYNAFLNYGLVSSTSIVDRIKNLTFH